MKLIEPEVKLLTQEEGVDAYKHHVAECARICYASSGDNDEGLFKNLMNNKHYSMLRHGTIYYKIPYAEIDKSIMRFISTNSYINSCIFGDFMYVAINGQSLIENPYIINYIGKYEITSLEAFNIKYLYNNIVRYTFIVTTQISTSRELNRVSPNNIAEQSTRYCNFSQGKFGNEISICKPHWYDGASDAHKNLVVNSWATTEKTYFAMLKTGILPEDARGVLPLDTATKCAYTYSIKEWCHILALRYYGTTGRPHPNAKIIAGMIRDELNQYYDVDKLMFKFGYKIN